MQVTLARLDGKILLERLRIVAIIAQLAGGLHEERGCGTVGNEVVGITDTEQMGKYLIVRGRGGRDAADGSSPLPKGKRILQHTIVVYLFNGCTELESFSSQYFSKRGSSAAFRFNTSNWKSSIRLRSSGVDTFLRKGSWRPSSTP